jgi:hypothetical protein
MRRRLTSLVLTGFVLVLLQPAAPASADELAGAQALLCTPVEVTVCVEGGDCVVDTPWNLNLPQFLEVNLKDKRLSTTKASGENRSTPIRTLERDGDLIFIQGIENGRAFSFVISETTGILSVAVARDGKAVSVFGACTPMAAPATAK